MINAVHAFHGTCHRLAFSDVGLHELDVRVFKDLWTMGEEMIQANHIVASIQQRPDESLPNESAPTGDK